MDLQANMKVRKIGMRCIPVSPRYLFKHYSPLLITNNGDLMASIPKKDRNKPRNGRTCTTPLKSGPKVFANTADRTSFTKALNGADGENRRSTAPEQGSIFSRFANKEGEDQDSLPKEDEFTRSTPVSRAPLEAPPPSDLIEPGPDKLPPKAL